MDFSELEALEGLRWSWNSWPVSKSVAEDLVVPLSVMFTPLMQPDGLPLLTYDPLLCPTCNAVLNPYARVDYPSRIWTCPFCYHKNPFPKSYSVINEDNIPAELFPTYNTVEYKLGKKGSSMPQNSLGNVVGVSTSTSISRMGSFSSSSLSLPAPGLDKTGMGFGPGPAFVFVVDACTVEDELRVLKNELLHVIARLPEYALVGLIVFDSMVRVYDLAFTHCLRVVLFPGDRNPSPEQVTLLMIASLSYYQWNAMQNVDTWNEKREKRCICYFIDVLYNTLLPNIRTQCDISWSTNFTCFIPLSLWLIYLCLMVDTEV